MLKVYFEANPPPLNYTEPLNLEWLKLFAQPKRCSYTSYHLRKRPTSYEDEGVASTHIITSMEIGLTVIPSDFTSSEYKNCPI